MIIIPVLFLFVRRIGRTWKANEAARERFWSRRRLGYGMYATLEALRTEWTWRLYSSSLTSAEALKIRLQEW